MIIFLEISQSLAVNYSNYFLSFFIIIDNFAIDINKYG